MKTSGGILLAFDLGTTGFKAALFDDTGQLLALARRATPSSGTAGRVEMTLDLFHAALIALVQDLSAECDLSGVRGISFSSQANSFALFDSANRPLTPIILWTDARAIGIDEPLNRLPGLHAISGVPSVNHEFAQAKLRWTLANNPDVASRAQKVSFISDLLVEWMTGRHETEIGLACLTALADRASETWSAQRIELLGLSHLQWPRVRRAGDEVGPILPDLADQLGLPRSAVFYMGCLDQYAGAIGTGVIHPRGVCETTGTALAVVECVPADAPPPGPEVFEGPSFSADRIFRMTFSSTSANMLEWFRAHHHPGRSFDSLVELAMSSATAADIGRVTSTIEDAFSHADLSAAPGPIVRGILQRVCEELYSLLGDLNARHQPIRSAGGAARSDAWLQMKADRLGVPVFAASTPEPTCRGAAMLTAHGLGLGSIDELANRWCSPRAVFIPKSGPPELHT